MPSDEYLGRTIRGTIRGRTSGGLMMNQVLMNQVLKQARLTSPGALIL
jgi:hypothetical protein